MNTNITMTIHKNIAVRIWKLPERDVKLLQTQNNSLPIIGGLSSPAAYLPITPPHL